MPSGVVAPDGWREPCVQISYLLYISLIIVLWGGLTLGALGSLYLVMALVGQMLYRGNTSIQEQHTRRWQLGFLGVYSSVVLVGMLWVSLQWIIYMGLGACVLFAIMIMLPTRDPIQFLWRREKSVRVHSVSTLRLLGLMGLGSSLLALALTLLTTGGDLVATTDAARHSMPLTIILGRSFAWLMPMALLMTLIVSGLIWFTNPAHPVRPRMFASGQLAAMLIRPLQQLSRKRGWKMATEPRLSLPADVITRLVPRDQSDATEFDPVWPLKISLEDLESGPVFERLERRHELQCRRRLLKGLRKLVWLANQESGDSEGYWFAPHLWCQLGLFREETRPSEDDDEADIVMPRITGPSYATLYDPATRHHAYTVLRALQIDLIFIEQGIKYRQIKSVMKTLFDLYDRHAGQRRAEDITFRGLVKMRVILHDFEFDQPFESSHYPEPDYNVLARARVMHIFKDRGDDEANMRLPADSSRDPVPLGMG